MKIYLIITKVFIEIKPTKGTIGPRVLYEIKETIEQI